MARKSNYLSDSAVNAFERIGEIMMPRHGDFPSFSELGVIAHIDGILEHVPADDRSALNLLLTVLAFFPEFLLRGFLNLVERGRESSGPLGGLFRQLNTGLKSVVVTLYFSGKTGAAYAGKTPLDVIDYHLTIVR